MKALLAATAMAAALCASTAHASVVDFGPLNYFNPVTTFSDGTLTHGTSPGGDDGFYSLGGPAAILVGSAWSNQVRFNSPVRLHALTAGICPLCADIYYPANFTVSLYDAGSLLLDSRSITASSTEETLIFNRPGVSTVEFTYDPTPPDTGRHYALLGVQDITYALGGVPEPAAWALMIGGFGLAGAALRRRRALA